MCMSVVTSCVVYFLCCILLGVCNSIKNPVTKKMVLDLCDRRNRIQGGVADAERKRPPLNGTERDSELMPPPGKRLQSRPNVD